jgi:murein DD-endopeptidase MepM/ murein hydrolase activator NlpD
MASARLWRTASARSTRLLALLLLLLPFVQACRRNAPQRSVSNGVAHGPTRAANVFDDFLSTPQTPADGFDFPFGNPDGTGSYTDHATGKRFDGWYVATHFAEEYDLGLHTGEDWNGTGGGDTDLGQDVSAVAHGRVVFAEHCGRLWGNVVVIEHTFYENHEKRVIRSLYAHLNEIKVRAGQDVRRRQLIATIGQDPDKFFNAHLHLELRWDTTLAPTYWPSADGKDAAWLREHYAAPTAFIQSHRALHVPQTEATLVLVNQDEYRMRLVERGRTLGEFDVGFGQAKGEKRVRGDNKTPKGMYFVIRKHRGKFEGPYGEYYGGHWIKINYPNKFDAARGRAEGIVTEQEAAQIAESWRRRAPTLENTALGGGIGFHGWIEEWENDGPRHLSWGCVVMHLSDIRNHFDHIPEGAMVVIF